MNDTAYTLFGANTLLLIHRKGKVFCNWKENSKGRSEKKFCEEVQ